MSYPHVKNPVLRWALNTGKFQFPGHKQICLHITEAAFADDCANELISDMLLDVRMSALEDFKAGGKVDDLRNFWAH